MYRTLYRPFSKWLRATGCTPLVSNIVYIGHAILFGKLNLGDCDLVSM